MARPDFELLAALIPQTKTEAATDTVVAAAISSPLWLPLLKEISDVAALLLPIAGVVWIVVQIVAKIWLTRRILAKRERPK